MFSHFHFDENHTYGWHDNIDGSNDGYGSHLGTWNKQRISKESSSGWGFESLTH